MQSRHHAAKASTLHFLTNYNTIFMYYTLVSVVAVQVLQFPPSTTIFIVETHPAAAESARAPSCIHIKIDLYHYEARRL